ncbi:MAG: glycosyltransferase family 4 protein [Verrucomicrobia bacterium]|nr:glycosyltransferase family 4 protein [Verrucomicrobiota bacterium]
MPTRSPHLKVQPGADPAPGRNPSLAYLFERFPAFTQTFCAREVLELSRQGLAVPIYSIRRPVEPPPSDLPLQDLDVRYLPDTNRLRFKLEARLLSPQYHQHWDAEGDTRDKNRYREALYLGRRLRRHGIGHLHVHFASLAARTAWWIKRLHGIPYSLTAHAKDIFRPKPDQRVPMEVLIRDAAFVVSVSNYGADYLRARVPEAAGRILRIYNGLDLSRFRAARPEATPIRLLAIGRLIEKKGFIYLLQACRDLNRAGLPFSCRIVGEGPEHDHLAQYIERERLSPRVQLVGARTQGEIADLLAEASIFVFPAVHDRDRDSDNLPTVIAEAMASGLPVVSTWVAGIPEMVVPDRNGLLVEERNPSRLAQAIQLLAEDPARRVSFGTNSRRLAEQHFDLHKTVAQLRETFRERVA